MSQDKLLLELSTIIANTTYKSITLKGQLSQQIVDLRKAMDIIKENYIIVKK